MEFGLKGKVAASILLIAVVIVGYYAFPYLILLSAYGLSSPLVEKVTYRNNANGQIEPKKL